MKRLKKSLRSDLWVILLDIIAVNGAYLLALLIRFYVHFRFTSAIGDFREYYLEFTPYYTVICLFVFFVCGLYDGMWRYAGLNDMNRIIAASVITAAVHVLGTKLFVNSMPTSYYIIGAFLQFLMIAVIRFAYRFLEIRRQRNEKRRALTIPVMVVGSGSRGKAFIRYLEDNSPFNVVVIAGNNSGSTMEGIPIVDYASIPMQIKYNNVQAVFIADEGLSQTQKDEIRTAADGIEVMDYIEYLSDLERQIPLDRILRVIDGPVTVTVDGKERAYSSAQECLMELRGSYEAIRITGAAIETKRMPEG